MKWGGDRVGVVLTRNEVWLLLNALSSTSAPSVDRDGNRLEPWVVGELAKRLQRAMHPDPVSDVEERPIIRVDSDMGRSLAAAGIKPQVIEDGYDVGTLISECARRGLGLELRLPTGAGVETPVEVRITAGNGHHASSEGGDEFIGLERPVVALARALLGAMQREHVFTDGPAESSEREFEEHVIYENAIAPGERDQTIAEMLEGGWEIVTDDSEGFDGRILFRRPHSV